MKLEQAARQALVALVAERRLWAEVNLESPAMELAITALQKALAEQAEQEPVGVVEGSGEWGIAGVLVAGVPIGTKLYAAPVRTKDLTDDEIHNIRWHKPTDIDFARAVIAADRELNK